MHLLRVAAALLLPLALGLNCEPRFAIVSPEDGATVESSRFPIAVRLPEGADPASLEIRLNGESLPFAQDEDGDPVAQAGPGGALQSWNTVVATVLVSGSPAVTEASFAYAPPPAAARRITDPEDLIRGPLGQSRIGDYLLENDVARFIVQDAPKREIYGLGQFGGNLIDMELVGRENQDNFIEMQPILNIETVINAQSVMVLNDGSDGQPAVVESCGPDDTLDGTNPSIQAGEFGFPIPPGLDEQNYPIVGCTRYILAPGARHLELVTTITNQGPDDLALFVGDAVNAAGEVDPWVIGPGGLGDLLLGIANSVGFVGFGDGRGVDYSRTSIPFPGAISPDSLTVVISGITFVIQSNDVTGVLLSQSSFVVPGNASRSFSRHVAVGDGDGAGALGIERDVRGQPMGTLHGCATVGGAPAPDTRIAVLDAARTALVSHFVTGDDGCYSGPVPPGNHVAAGWRRGTLFEGGGPDPVYHPLAIVQGETARQDVAFPATGRLRVTTRVDGDEPLPARVTVVGFDPSPQPELVAVFDSTGMFTDFLNDPEPFGVVRAEYSDADGVAEFDVEPGTYEIAVSRGSEYSLHTRIVTVPAGVVTEATAELAPVIESDGFVSSDFHVHAIRSLDARISNTRRVAQFAGEGVDNIVITDHGAHTDLGPVIQELGLESWVTATIGEEITTSDNGHYNAYPMAFDPSQPSGGATDWSRAAPPGEDFVSLGSYSRTPGEIFDEARTQAAATPWTTVQINHVGTHFAPLKIDTSLVPPRSLLSDQEKIDRRQDPAAGELFFPFPALELWNGASRGAQGAFLNERIGIWMNLLNQGIVTTAIADTDTHDFRSLRSAGARSWTPSSSDEPAGIRGDELAAAVESGRVVGGQGPYVQASLRNADDPGADPADLSLGSDTGITAPGGNLDLEIHVQAPVWAEYDEIRIYANAPTAVTGTNGGVPVDFTATPALTLARGADFAVDEVDVNPGVPGARRLETWVTVPFRGLVQDTWFVVMVKGTDGVSKPMFPVFAADLARASNATLADLVDGNLGESGVLALGFTNALYADVDGVPGFQAPLAP